MRLTGPISYLGGCYRKYPATQDELRTQITFLYILLI